MGYKQNFKKLEGGGWPSPPFCLCFYLVQSRRKKFHNHALSQSKMTLNVDSFGYSFSSDFLSFWKRLLNEKPKKISKFMLSTISSTENITDRPLTSKGPLNQCGPIIIRIRWRRRSGHGSFARLGNLLYFMQPWCIFLPGEFYNPHQDSMFGCQESKWKERNCL